MKLRKVLQLLNDKCFMVILRAFDYMMALFNNNEAFQKYISSMLKYLQHTQQIVGSLKAISSLFLQVLLLPGNET